MKLTVINSYSKYQVAIITLLLLFLSSSIVQATSDFTFLNQNGKMKLQLSDYFKNKIRTIAPTFRFIRAENYSHSIRASFKDYKKRPPHLIIEDFNNDGRSDLAVIGYDASKPQDLKIVIFQTNKFKGYIVRNVMSIERANIPDKIATPENDQFGLSTYLTLHKIKSKRRIASNKRIKVKSKRIKHLLGIETWGSTRVIYFQISKKSIRRR